MKPLSIIGVNWVCILVPLIFFNGGTVYHEAILQGKPIIHETLWTEFIVTINFVIGEIKLGKLILISEILINGVSGIPP